MDRLRFVMRLAKCKAVSRKYVDSVLSFQRRENCFCLPDILWPVEGRLMVLGLRRARAVLIDIAFSVADVLNTWHALAES